MGHIQGPTPIQFDNIVSNGIINYTIVSCRSKAMNMHFDWCWQKEFNFYWKQVKHNLAKYPSKHHSTKHHISVQPAYLPNTIKTYIYIYLNDQNYQQHCKGVSKHICHQLLNDSWITDIQYHQCPLRQCWNNNIILHNNISAFPKQTVQTRQLKPTVSFEQHLLF